MSIRGVVFHVSCVDGVFKNARTKVPMGASRMAVNFRPSKVS